MSLARRLANRARDLQFLPFMDHRWRAQRLGKVMCLLYHRVDEAGQCPFLDRFGAPAISRDALADELRFLLNLGARFMTFADLRRGDFPGASEFGVIVSFDDGFRDNYTHGLEVLESLGIRGIIFQSTALIEAKTLIWEHALYWFWSDEFLTRSFTELAHRRLADSRSFTGLALLSYLREHAPTAEVESLLAEMGECHMCQPELTRMARQLYPSAEQLTRARANNHELGSHGHHHYKRTSIDASVFENELRQSIRVLSGILGEPPKAFSFPFDSYQADDIALCGRYFEQVVTVGAAPILTGYNPLVLPRYTWPGPQPNRLRRRRWLLTGRV